MNTQLSKIIQATKNSPKDEITFKIMGASKETLEIWIAEMATQGLKAQVVTLSSGDMGLHIIKTSIINIPLSSVNDGDLLGLPSIKLSKKLDSSAISEISWENEILSVEFNSGKIYHYENVSKDVYDDFANSPSAGRFFQKNIKDKYSFNETGTALAR